MNLMEENHGFRCWIGSQNGGKWKLIRDSKSWRKKFYVDWRSFPCLKSIWKTYHHHHRLLSSNLPVNLSPLLFYKRINIACMLPFLPICTLYLPIETVFFFANFHNRKRCRMTNRKSSKKELAHESAHISNHYSKKEKVGRWEGELDAIYFHL